MEITIKGEAKEIAALVRAVRERQGIAIRTLADQAEGRRREVIVWKS